MRNLTATMRNSLEAMQAEDVIVIMAKIYSPELDNSIYINSDVVDYIYNDFHYIGWAFQMSFLNDDDELPRAKMSIPNVDRILGESLLALTLPLRLKIELVLRSDFNDDVPRRPVGTPNAEYVAPELFLRNISCDVMNITADISSFDLSAEPFPRIRSTQNLLPGLYR